jgi:hypothetical protein
VFPRRRHCPRPAHLLPDTANIILIGLERKVADVRAGPGIGVRPVAGNFPVVSRAAARAERLTGCDQSVQEILGYPEFQQAAVGVVDESVGARLTPVDQVPGQLNAAVLFHGGLRMVGQGRGRLGEKREKMRIAAMSWTRWMAAHISASVSPMPTMKWDPA